MRVQDKTGLSYAVWQSFFMNRISRQEAFDGCCVEGCRVEGCHPERKECPTREAEGCRVDSCCWGGLKGSDRWPSKGTLGMFQWLLEKTAGGTLAPHRHLGHLGSQIAADVRYVCCWWLSGAEALNHLGRRASAPSLAHRRRSHSISEIR